MADRIDDSQAISTLPGSFWTETYAGHSQVTSICDAVAEAGRQSLVTAEELAASTGRESALPYRRTTWHPLTLKLSELNASRAALLRFGDGAVLGPQSDGSRYYFGVSRQTYYTFPTPTNLKRFSYAATRISSPGRVWLVGVDVLFDHERSLLLFLDNPLDEPTAAVSSVFHNSDLSDASLTLWLADAEFDHGDVYEQHGFVFGMPPQQDSAWQQPGLIALADNVVGGTNLSDFMALLSAGTGVPLTTEAEVVEHIVEDRHGVAVVTDKNCHRLPAGSASTVAVGDTLLAGTFVGSGVRVATFQNGIVPAWLNAIAIGRGLLDRSIAGEFLLQNADVPFITQTTSGSPVSRFEIGGLPAESAAFFREVHTRLAANESSLFDVVGNWQGEDYPTIINPLAFFADQWFRCSLVVVHLTQASLRSKGVSHLRLLPRVFPPHLLLLVVIDLRPPVSDFILPQTASIGGFSAAVKQTASGTAGEIVSSRRYVTNCA